MVKVIMFDMWGTVIENGVFPSPLRQIKRILRINAKFPVYITKFEESFMLNNFENLTEGFKEVCKLFDINPPPFIIDKCVGLWNKNAILAKPFEEALETLAELKNGYKLVLLCNTDPFSADQVIKKYNLKDYFDEIFLSYSFGKLKTSENYFKEILKKMKLKKDDVLMVGDSLESDMKPAENAGIKTVLIDRFERREYENKIKSLDQLMGVLNG